MILSKMERAVHLSPLQVETDDGGVAEEYSVDVHFPADSCARADDARDEMVIGRRHSYNDAIHQSALLVEIA